MAYDGDGNRVSETVGGTTTKYLVDDLNPTGYSQVVDELVNGSVTRTYAYTVDQVRDMAGPLNEYSLLSSVEDAERFKEAIKTDPRNPAVIPDHNRGVIVEVWGRP